MHSWAEKVELPIIEGPFTGMDCKAGESFEVHQTKPPKKLQLAFTSMEGVSVHWFGS